MSIICIVIISFFISLTWLHYFKKIDLFEQEKIVHIVVTFVLGSVFPFSIYLIHYFIYEALGISESDNPVYNFVFYTFGVGLLEEIIKFIPVLIIIYIFKKAINEPLDYVKYICVSALGFAFGENIQYALNYGSHVLLARSILSVPGHMFFSAIFIYGIIEFRYDKKSTAVILKYILLASLAHGIYDFLLDFHIPFLSSLLHILFFMVLISVFVNILNNCLNMSPFYSPKMSVDQEVVRKYLVGFYMILIPVILIVAAIDEGIEVALGSYLWLMFWQSSILFILIIRLSRFSIIANHKNKIRIKLPFYFNPQPNRTDFLFFFGFFTIRGESYNSHQITRLFNEDIRVIPLSLKRSYLNKVFEGFIEKKVHEDNTVYFLVKIYMDSTKQVHKHFVLIPKTNGITHNADGNPIVGLNAINHDKLPRLEFLEWVVLKKK
ncbi:MAG: PrsW family intramembrane metalloprotease [Bacteroidota bacterium]